MKGYIYILRDPRNPEILKIGKTKNAPAKRLKQLNGTSTLYDLELMYSRKVSNMDTAEADLHRRFAAQRVRRDREFFKVRLNAVKKIADEYAPRLVPRKRNYAAAAKERAARIERREAKLVSDTARAIADKAQKKLDQQAQQQAQQKRPLWARLFS